MASVRSKALYRDLEAIFDGVSTTALGDALLLDRFLTGRGAVKERAFETLVGRHGPMVFQVCRQRLGDRHEAEDACQAVFLVLARRAGSVRNRESIDGWLYGVAVRVAARARKDADRRRLRERQAAEDLAADGLDSTPELHGPSEAVHQALARLPEKYRSPIVLCHLEGLTHDQAAARLSCPVGTVRSRLARGRDQLRRLLTRRSATAPSALGWLALDAAVVPPPAVPASLAAETVRVACALTASPFLVSALPSVPLSLMQGALIAMRFEKLALLAAATAPAVAIALAAGIGLAQEPKPARPPFAAPVERAADEPPKAIPEAKPLQVGDLVKMARERLEAQKGYYEEGRITIDRFIDASQRLRDAERLAAKGDAQELAAASKRHVDRLKEVEVRERRDLEAGKSTIADLSEAVERRLAAELALADAETAAKTAAPPAPASLEAVQQTKLRQLRLLELVKVAQERFEISQRLFTRGQLASEQVVDASVQLAEAELLAADGDPAKTAEASGRQIEALKALEELAKSRKEAARGTEADVLAIRQRRLVAELALDPVPSPREAALETRVKALEAKLDAVLKRLDGPSR